MEYLATFHTHYGAMRFHQYCKRNGTAAKMTPVPRDISASCGVCVRFETQQPPATGEHEDMERCYAVDEHNAYMPIEG